MPQNWKLFRKTVKSVPIVEIADGMGAYNHGVLINTSISVQLCGNGLVGIYYRPRDSFSADFCLMLVAFLEPEIQSAIN